MPCVAEQVTSKYSGMRLDMFHSTSENSENFEPGIVAERKAHLAHEEPGHSSPGGLRRGVIFGYQVTLVLAHEEPCHSSPGELQRGIIYLYQVTSVLAHEEPSCSGPWGIMKGNNLRILVHTCPGL